MADIDEPRVKIGELENKPVYADQENIPQKEPAKPEPEKPKWDFMELVKIKGIGAETAKDIADIFSTKEDLIEALKNGRVPLRNDTVELLKSNLIK